MKARFELFGSDKVLIESFDVDVSVVPRVGEGVSVQTKGAETSFVGTVESVLWEVSRRGRTSSIGLVIQCKDAKRRTREPGDKLVVL